MIDPNHVPPLADEELLARFIVNGNEMRADDRGKTLYGRADLRASSCRIVPLDVVAQPILPHNPNHADIVGYPERKDEQLSLAQKLAAAIEGNWIATPHKPDEL